MEPNFERLSRGTFAFVVALAARGALAERAGPFAAMQIARMPPAMSEGVPRHEIVAAVA